MNTCTYLFHVNNEVPYKGLVDIVCDPGQEMRIVAGTRCTIDIPPQTNLGPVTYATLLGLA